MYKNRLKSATEKLDCFLAAPPPVPFPNCRWNSLCLLTSVNIHSDEEMFQIKASFFFLPKVRLWYILINYFNLTKESILRKMACLSQEECVPVPQKQGSGMKEFQVRTSDSSEDFLIFWINESPLVSFWYKLPELTSQI